MPFDVIASQTVYRGRVFAIRLDQVRLPNGKNMQVDLVEHAAAVTLAPLDAEGNLLFIRQYRHPAGQVLLELPAGVIEAGEDPQASAARELREETGMAAGRLEKLGEFYLAPGYSTELMHVFLAGDLVEDPLPGDEDEMIDVERIPVKEALRMAAAGEIQDAKTLAALLLARPHLL